MIDYCFITLDRVLPVSFSSRRSTRPDVSSVSPERSACSISSRSRSLPCTNSVLFYSYYSLEGCICAYTAWWHRNRSSEELHRKTQLARPEQRLRRSHITQYRGLVAKVELGQSQLSHQDFRRRLHVPVSPIRRVDDLPRESIAQGLHEHRLKHHQIIIAVVRQNCLLFDYLVASRAIARKTRSHQ